MSDATPSDAAPIDEALSGLGELAACDLMLAKRFAGRIQSLPDDEDDKAMALSRSYQRMARSYRQTVIVQARLRRELKAEAKIDALDAAKLRGHRVYAHKAAIHAQIRPIIWTMEREEERCEALDGLLEDRIEDAAAGLDFLDLTPEAHAARILEAMDDDFNREPDPDPEPNDEDDDDPSSPIGGGGPPEGGWRGTATAETPPEIPLHPAAQGPPPPTGEESAEPEPPEPDPPPRPPDPEPYIPPWEKLRPGATYPDGGGW